MNIHEKTEFLSQASNLEGTEAGEYWEALANILGPCMSDWYDYDTHEKLLQELDVAIVKIESEYRIQFDERDSYYFLAHQSELTQEEWSVAIDLHEHLVRTSRSVNG